MLLIFNFCSHCSNRFIFVRNAGIIFVVATTVLRNLLTPTRACTTHRKQRKILLLQLSGTNLMQTVTIEKENFTLFQSTYFSF